MASTITKKLTNQSGTVITVSFPNGGHNTSSQAIAPVAGPVTNLGNSNQSSLSVTYVD